MGFYIINFYYIVGLFLILVGTNYLIKGINSLKGNDMKYLAPGIATLPRIIVLRSNKSIKEFWNSKSTQLSSKNGWNRYLMEVSPSLFRCMSLISILMGIILIIVSIYLFVR